MLIISTSPLIFSDLPIVSSYAFEFSLNIRNWIEFFYRKIVKKFRNFLLEQYTRSFHWHVREVHVANTWKRSFTKDYLMAFTKVQQTTWRRSLTLSLRDLRRAGAELWVFQRSFTTFSHRFEVFKLWNSDSALDFI